jgi:hypothetical protein
MPKIPGNGGYAVIEDGGPLTRVDNSDYSYETESVNDDVTDSGSGGVAEGLPCLIKLTSFTMTVIENSDFYVQAIGFETGNVIPQLWLRRGASAQWDLVTNTIVRNNRVRNPQGGEARRLEITCEYGSIQLNVAAPGNFT